MRVERLHIKNFRSIEELDIKLQPLCAFIGPNNAGKSNVLDALDLVLGETYPTIRAFSEGDFRNYDIRQTIEIQTTFSDPINDDYGNPLIYGLTLRVGNLDDLEYFPVDSSGNRIYYRTGTPMRISTRMREQVPLLHIDVDRRVSSQLRPTSWTLWGRIQKELNRKFVENAERVGAFKTKISEATGLLQIPELAVAENTLRDRIRAQTNLPDLSLKFRLTDPIEHYRSLRPYLKNIELGPDFDPEQMGLGTQSALVIALAEVYRRLVRESVIMLIDEPELYLHPHACRHFYSLLKELCEGGVQVIYTTHDPAFLDITDFQCIYLVKKDGDKTKVFEGCSVSVSEEDKLRMKTRFDTTVSEVFYAKGVLLVEGAEDKIACIKAFQLGELSLDKEGISITGCGGKPGIPFMAQILTSLRIPTCVLCDRDHGKPTDRESESIKQIVGIDNFFELPDKLESALGLTRKLDQVELVEFLQQYGSLDELPEGFKSVIIRVLERIRSILI